MLRLSEIRKFISFEELLDSLKFPGFRLPAMLYSNLLLRGFRKRRVLFDLLFCLIYINVQKRAYRTIYFSQVF